MSPVSELLKKCQICGSNSVVEKITKIGSRIKVSWNCVNKHTGDWESCPNVRGMAETNLVAAAAILFTGATYSHITHWAELCNLQFLSKTTYYDVQSSYLFLVTEKTYQGQQCIVFARLIGGCLDGEGVEVCGDARSDSPGHSAKYSTYSFMDDLTKQIVLLDLLQVTQAKSSVAMEPLGFKNGLRILLDEGLDIEVITTDRHPST